MSDPIRSLIRQEIESGYEEPAPDLTRRALAAIPTHHLPQRRSPFQTLALTAALVLIAIGVLIGRGLHVFPLSLDAGTGSGLRPPQAPYSIVDNRFISASTGWILIQMHTTSGPTVLLKTTDGGAHWVEQFRFSGAGGIDYIDFSRNGRDGRMAWFEGGPVSASGQPLAIATPEVLKVYATHDGGAHWKVESAVPQNNPPKSSTPPAYWPGGAEFFLPGTADGWQVRVPSNSQLPIVLMHTVDGGGTWTQLSELPAGSRDGAPYFSDARNGWYIVSDSRSFSFDGSGRPIPFTPPIYQLYVSHDGGLSWAPLTLSLPSISAEADMDTHIEQPIMFDSKNGVLPIKVMAGPTSTQAQPSKSRDLSLILKTSDGGNHWGSLTQVPGTPEDGAILFLSSDHWLASSGGMLRETHDGGLTWATRRVLADGFTMSMASWNTIPPDVIWAQVGAGGLVRSTDGGRTWEAVTPPTVH